MKWSHKFSKLQIPLAAKLTMVMTGLVTLSVSSTTSVSIYRNHTIFRQELEQQAEVLLSTLVSATADSLYFGDVELLDDIIDELTFQETLLSSTVYQEDGRIIANTSDREKHEFTLTADPLGKKILQSQTTFFDWQSDRLLAAKPIILGDDAIGVIAVELSISALNQKNIDERNQSLILALILGTIGAIISILLSK